jgi:hypothetical protein
VAADAYLMGMDGMELLTTKDNFTFRLMSKIVEAGNNRMDERDKRLAAYTAVEVIKRIK